MRWLWFCSIACMVFLLTLFLSAFSVQAQMTCTDVFSAPRIVRGEENIEKPPGFFRYLDRTYGFRFEANLMSDSGIVFIEAYLNRGPLNIRSHYSGRELYTQMIQHFGVENITGISGVWVGGTNLSQYQMYRSRGDTPKQAAAKTWSGRLAAEHGFTDIMILEAGRDPMGPLTDDNQVEVIFFKEKLR